MPRISKAAHDAQNVVSLDKNRKLLQPMGKLKPLERDIFDLVARNNLHLGLLDIPLIMTFAITAAKINAKGSSMKVAELDKAARLLTIIATKLRITPQSRMDPEKLSRRHQNSNVVRNKNPWVDDEESDGEEETGEATEE